MKKINLKTWFVIIAIYEILYLLYTDMAYGVMELLKYDIDKLFLWVVIVPVGAIAIYFFIRWISNCFLTSYF